MKNIIIDILNKETEYNNRILSLENEIKELKNQLENSKNEALKLNLYDNGRYCSLSDFCRISKNLLFIKDTELKQWLCQQGYLIKESDKYVPLKEQDVCILVENSIYIKYEFIRKQVLFLRTLVYINNERDIMDFVDVFKGNKDSLIEQMANTVYVSYKQNSNEFKHHKDNKFFVGLEKDSVEKYIK